MSIVRLGGFLLIFLCMVISVFSQTKVDGVAAIVDNQIILYSEVFTLAEQEAATLKLNRSTEPDKFVEILEKWLTILIDNKIQIVAAESDTLVVGFIFDEKIQEQVNGQIQSEIQLRGSEQAVENFWDVSIQDLRVLLSKQTRERLLIEELQRQKTADVSISRSEIEQFYETYKDSMPLHPATYDLNHILVVPSNSADVIEAKKVFMDSLRQRIVNGEDFATMARNFSEDPGSAANGGDLGWQTPGTFVSEFDSAIATLSPGQISGTVHSQFGYHIIQLLEKSGTRFHSRHILSLLVPTEEDASRAVDDLNSYRESALNDARFDSLASLYSDDPEVENTKGHMGEWEVERLQSVLPEFIQAITNLNDGEISEPFKTQFGYHIAKLNKYSTERQRNTTDDYDYIYQIALQNKKSNYYIELVRNIKENAYIEIKMNFDEFTLPENSSSDQ